jgi:hypothetical protein
MQNLVGWAEHGEAQQKQCWASFHSAQPTLAQHERINLRQVDNVAPKTETRYIPPMHFSRHISQLHSTFSLLAALKLRLAR